MACWKCHEATTGPVCVGCGAIQPPPSEPDFFALLSLPRTYDLDLLTLDSRYRDVSRLVHPDRFAGRPAVERRMSLQWTAAVNAARRVLRDPLMRARYLASGRAEPDEIGPAVDDAFLEEMFELRVRAQESPDDVRAEAEERRATLMREIEEAFVTHEAGNGTLDQVEERLARIQYLEGLLPPRRQ